MENTHQLGTFITYPTYDFRHIFKSIDQVNIIFPFKVDVFATKIQLGNEINNTNQIWNSNKLVMKITAKATALSHNDKENSYCKSNRKYCRNSMLYSDFC
mgnify:FL=1